MEPVAVARGSRLSLLLISVVLLSLLLACWFFWQWWMVRHDLGVVHVSNAAPPPAPVVRAAPAPAPVAAPGPVVVPKPAPAPVAIPTVPAMTTRPVAPPEVPAVSNYAPTPWPLDLHLSAIFYNKTSPHAFVNGAMYNVGDDVGAGVVVKKIEKDKVTFEWNGRTRVVNLEGQ
jgi:hypothetical protein